MPHGNQRKKTHADRHQGAGRQSGQAAAEQELLPIICRISWFDENKLMCDENAAIFHVIYKTVLFIDPSAELPLQVSCKRLGFPDSFHAAVSLDVFDELIDALQRLFVLSLPVEVIFPGVI